ncbi:hypothetical protein AQUSIP_08360 [Aquicella siphonis]|uniref:N-acetyltransferase domain-containing protein n=2 Tax=Aquicella siphonis TaxID=254247 RepID=A0A5E4PGR0_9COXI|nr:hypothetical protein AQUSIP_08360 [Aquicella siphonis]
MNYPEHLIASLQLPDGTAVTIRPARPEDVDLIKNFFRQLSPQRKHALFMENFRELPQDMLTRLAAVDYNHDMVLLAMQLKNGKESLIALSRYVTTAFPDECEFSVVVSDEWQNSGIDSHIMNALINAAKQQKLKTMTGMFLASNIEIMRLVEHLGFAVKDSDDPTVKHATKSLS